MQTLMNSIYKVETYPLSHFLNENENPCIVTCPKVKNKSSHFQILCTFTYEEGKERQEILCNINLFTERATRRRVEKLREADPPENGPSLPPCFCLWVYIPGVIASWKTQVVDTNICHRNVLHRSLHLH